MAILFGMLGLLVILLLVAGYVRFAPRFSTDESTLKVVRADRVRPGEELPRRTVDIKAAAPMVVAPPPLPQPAGVAASAPRRYRGRPRAGCGCPGARARAGDRGAAAPGAAGACERAPRPNRPRSQPGTRRGPRRTRLPPLPRRTPRSSLDQEVFDQTLKELLDKGTDKRVAEGQARRAAMIAARKKAAGEA